MNKNSITNPHSGSSGTFHLSELASRTSQLASEMGFFQRVLLKNHLLRAYYLGFDWSGWIVLIKSEILILNGGNGLAGEFWQMESPLRLPFVAEVEFGNVGFEEKNLLEQRRSNNELNPHNFMAYYHADCLD